MSKPVKNISCAVCSKYINKNCTVALHKFPSNTVMQSLWLKACGINERDFSKNTVICSIHFERDCFKSIAKKILKSDAIPTKFMKRTKSLIREPLNIESQLSINNIKQFIESSSTPIVFHKMLDDWEPFKWNIQDWENIFENNPLNCRKGKITCSSEPLWERKCSQEFHKFNDILKTSEKVESSGSWLYFDYKYIGKQVNDKNFKSISWRKFGYESLNAKDSTLWIGSTGAHTPCHQDLYGINLVAQIYGTKRWILLPPDMGKYLLPSRVPYEESSCYSKINFSCPKILTSIDEKCKCISVVLSPGDVLYVPHKWWHYVENLSTAISINSWIPISKYDNLSRLNESIVRFLVSSVCSGVPENIQSRLLNPNELFSSNMTAESMKFIEQSLKTIKNEESSSLENMKFIIPSSSDYKFTVLNANQSIKNLQIDTKHHCTNHLPKTIEVNEESDIKEMILNSFCDENVVSQIAINLLKKN